LAALGDYRTTDRLSQHPRPETGSGLEEWMFSVDETSANKLKLLNTFGLKLYKARVYGLSYDLSGTLKQNAAFGFPSTPVRG
jgi:hypothetical protein